MSTQAQQHGALHAHARVQHAADEDAGEIRPEAEADVVDARFRRSCSCRSSNSSRNVRFASVSPILCSRTNSNTSNAPRAPEEFGAAARRSNPRLRSQPLARRRRTMSRRLSQHQTDEHRRQGEQQRRRCTRPANRTRAAITSASAAGRHGTDAPTVLRHAGADAELARLERLDAIGVDHDVVSRAGDRNQDGRDRRRCETRLRIDEREVHDRSRRPARPASSSHETRWPKRPMIGRRTPSTTHAHSHFRL